LTKRNKNPGELRSSGDDFLLCSQALSAIAFIFVTAAWHFAGLFAGVPPDKYHPKSKAKEQSVS